METGGGRREGTEPDGLDMRWRARSGVDPGSMWSVDLGIDLGFEIGAEGPENLFGFVAISLATSLASWSSLG